MNRRVFTKLAALGKAGGATQLFIAQAIADERQEKKVSANDRINVAFI